MVNGGKFLPSFRGAGVRERTQNLVPKTLDSRSAPFGASRNDGCYDVLTVWMPHSVFGRPRQRPARASSSGEVRLVQGMHPTERKPDATSGCGGSFACAYIASISSRETLANGLNFNRMPSSSTTGMAARRPPWKRLRPLIHALKGANARFSGSTLRIRQQASG